MIVVVEAHGAYTHLHVIEPETDDSEPGYVSYVFTKAQWAIFKGLINSHPQEILRGLTSASI